LGEGGDGRRVTRIGSFSLILDVFFRDLGTESPAGSRDGAHGTEPGDKAESF